MIFFLYCYMVALSFASSAGCAWYSYKLGYLKTTQTSPWLLVAAGFAMGFVHEAYKLLFYLDILNILYDFRMEVLMTSQAIQTLKYVLPWVGLGIMYKRREQEEKT